MKTLRVILVLLLVFGAGTVFGVVAARIATRNFIRRAISQPELLRERIQRELTRKLNLNDEQRRQVEGVLSDAQGQLRDLRMEFGPRFTTIISNSESRIDAILTPEQRARFEKIRRENRGIFGSKPGQSSLPIK